MLYRLQDKNRSPCYSRRGPRPTTRASQACTQCGPQPTSSAGRSLQPARGAAYSQGEPSLHPVPAAAYVQCGPKLTTGAGRSLQPGRAKLAPRAGRSLRPVRAEAHNRRGPQPTTRASQGGTQCGLQPTSSAGRSPQPARAAFDNHLQPGRAKAGVPAHSEGGHAAAVRCGPKSTTGAGRFLQPRRAKAGVPAYIGRDDMEPRACRKNAKPLPVFEIITLITPGTTLVGGFNVVGGPAVDVSMSPRNCFPRRAASRGGGHAKACPRTNMSVYISSDEALAFAGRAELRRSDEKIADINIEGPRSAAPQH